MGIKGLHKVLQKYAPGCYQTKHLSEFAYQRIAIDISLYLYKYKAIAGDRWMDSFVYLINCLRKWNIHCVFVYDSKAPVEKLEEQQRRRQVRAKQGDRVTELEQEIAVYEQGGEPSERMIDICKKEGVVSLLRQGGQNGGRQLIDLRLVKRKLETMRSQIISINDDDLEASREIFDMLQIPYIKATAEAEAYSSYLCIHGKVDAVLSEDTDVLAYGSPVFLTKIDTMSDTVVMITYKDVLSEMGMTKETFVDLCIMLGCDYNTNVPRVGPEKSLSLLKQHESIDNITEITEEDKQILHHVRIRELLTIPSEMDIYIPYCGIPDFKKVDEFLLRYGIRCNMNNLKKNLGASELSFVE